MQSLVLPGPTSLLSTPLGRPAEAEDGLVKFRSKFSPHRTAHQGYPSPPMSEPHSPSRRPAQSVESARLCYPQFMGASHRQDSFVQPPAPQSLYDAPSSAAHVSPLQPPLYPGEPQHRSQALSYQPGRATQHQPYGHIVQHNYGYGYQHANLPSYPGAQHAGPMIHQGAMIAPPARSSKPARRTKAHVASACVNCKKAHLSCDVQRPCGRCVASGKQDTCKDVQHKKRGRPRLRDDREFTRTEEGRPPSQLLSAPPPLEALTHQPTYPGGTHLYRGADSPALGSMVHQRDLINANLHLAAPASRDAAGSVGDYASGVLPRLYHAGSNLAYQKLPVAYLNLDLMIQKTNRAFTDLISFLGDVRGKHLGELLEARQNDSLQRLCNELRDERDEREPAYMAPITPIGQDPMRAVMDALVDQNIDQFTQGFTNRPMYLSFRIPGAGQYQSLQVQMRLAKTTLYFVTLVVTSPPRLTAPALLTQQLAPPTPSNASQTMSAPKNAPAPHITPHQSRRQSTTSSAPNSPCFNFSSVRTSLPMISPSSYSGSPSYGYSPTAGAESGYFPTYQPPPQPNTGSAYTSSSFTLSSHPPTSSASESIRNMDRPARLEGLQLPPIRTGPLSLGSPLHVETDGGGAHHGERERERVRLRDSPRPPSGTEIPRHVSSPGMGKRRRLNIHEVLE